MIPGPAAICTGTVMHQRLTPTEHRFTYPSTQIWLDPDKPHELTNRHPLWSRRWPAPVQIRRQDYFDGGTGPINGPLRELVFEATGIKSSGSVRMLSQPRMWGWLFNPISVFLLWDDDLKPPVAAVLEVSNTPWKQRHHYAVPLKPGPSSEGSALTAEFDKELHVSPFLDSNLIYKMRLTYPGTTKTKIAIDVVTTEGTLVLKTILAVEKRDPTRQNLGSVLRTNPFATHRVSAGIHAQAARLFLKGVGIVRHPKRSLTSGQKR